MKLFLYLYDVCLENTTKTEPLELTCMLTIHSLVPGTITQSNKEVGTRDVFKIKFIGASYNLKDIEMILLTNKLYE